MADWDSADLLSRAKFTAQRPATDESVSDAQWFSLLTEGQDHWVEQFATHVPESQYGPPVLLTTSDGGETYDFPSGDFPMGHVELRRSKAGGVMVLGPEWDMGADFARQGAKVRFPGQKTKTFADGPYARYVPVPGGISASSEPVLVPTTARRLIVYRAVAIWARRGGFRDPRPFEEEEIRVAWGDPRMPGDVGTIGALKKQYQFEGSSAFPQGAVSDWWRFIDDGSGYSVQR